MGASTSRQDRGKAPDVPFSTYASALTATALLRSALRKTRCEEPPPPPSPDAPPPPPSPEDEIAKAASSVSAFPNPGPYEMATQDCKRLVMLDTFDGFRCDINKQVSPFMAAVHSFWLGTSMIPDGRKSTYTFLTQVADESGVVMARVDPGRQSVDGRIQRALLGGIAMGKLQVQVSPEGQGDTLLTELDFGGLTWTGNLKYGSMAGGIVYGCSYLQSITPRLAMGAEGMYVAANQNIFSNYLLRYTIPAPAADEDIVAAAPKPKLPPGMPRPEGASSTICASYSGAQQAVSLNYKRVITPNRVTVGAELQFSPVTTESQVACGAEFKLSRSKISLCIDGSFRIQTLLEAKLGILPGSPSINFSADMNHAADDMRFGYGINIEG